MNYPTVAHIDIAALQHNLRVIKHDIPHSKIIAMVKREAYGHQAVKVAQGLAAGVDAFGVVFLQEAMQLYHAGIKQPILVLSGFLDQAELLAIDQHNFYCSVHNFDQIALLETTQLTKPLQVWLKIDTGMHRLGFLPEQVPAAYHRLMQIAAVHKPLKLMTHFAEADMLTSDKTTRQLDCLQTLIAKFGLVGERCIANSSAILKWPLAHADWSRPGITLYGVTPFATGTGLDLGLKPVMTLTSKIIAIHDLAAGEKVGYGGTFTCPEAMRVGMVAIGYGDGYPRNTKIGAPMLVNGMRTQLVGRVAMDMIGVDLRQLPNAQIGDEVVLWGKGLPVEEVALFTGESPYEMLGRLTARVHYI